MLPVKDSILPCCGIADLLWWPEGGRKYLPGSSCSSELILWHKLERRCSRHFVKKLAASLAPVCSLPAAQPPGFAAPLRGAAPSWTIWRMSVWFCIQTQSLQDEPRSWSDLLAQPAIFVFFWLCFIYFFTLCSITAGSLSSCLLVFSLSAKCQLSLLAG